MCIPVGFMVSMQFNRYFERYRLSCLRAMKKAKKGDLQYRRAENGLKAADEMIKSGEAAKLNRRENAST